MKNLLLFKQFVPFTVVVLFLIWTVSCSNDSSGTTDVDTSANGDTDTDVDGDSDTDSDTDTDTDTDGDTDSDADGDGDGDSDSDSDGDSDADSDADTDTTPVAGDTDYEPVGDGGAQGFSTKYWDCCKAHCSWPENVSGDPAPVCDINNTPTEPTIDQGTWFQGKVSGCDSPNDSNAVFTCWNQAPWAVSDTLSYGFVATHAGGAFKCGQCFQFDFDGESKQTLEGQFIDQGSASLVGKTMVVQATNIGYDVTQVANAYQFDIMIPGGGVGAFNGCSAQWGVDNSQLGEQYGGFLAKCYSIHGYNSPHATLKSCVEDMCNDVFSKNGMDDLKEGCLWYVNWMNVADNPAFKYKEVPCPDVLKSVGMR